MTGLTTRYKFIHFEMQPTRGKTSQWLCVNTNHAVRLGMVGWYRTWRQYCFFPEPMSVFNQSCLADIQDFIRQLNTAERR